MAAKKTRGCREPRDINIETYTNAAESTSPLLSSQSTSKSHSFSRTNSEETSFVSSPPGEITGAAACTSPDQINFISLFAGF